MKGPALPILVITNAKIWSPGMNAATTTTGSVAIEGGRIAAIGADIDAPASTRQIDAAGRFVMPGFIDAHLHLLMGGLSLQQLDLSTVTTRDQFEAAVAEHDRDLPKHQWLIAHGFSDDKLGGWPDKSWLGAAGNRPCVCWRADIHAAFVNDAVLELIGTDQLSHDPPGGRIGRDQNTGKPNGIMIETAAWNLVSPIIPDPPVDVRRNALLAAQQHALQFGITTVGSMEQQREIEQVFLPLREQMSLRVRLTVLGNPWPGSFVFGREFANDEHLAVIGYKAFADGTLGSRTARMLQPYTDDPENRGELIEHAATGCLPAWAQAVADAGLSPSIHAIGDEAARLALDAIAEIEQSTRPRIEHAQQIDEADIPRFAGVIASMQPLHKFDDGCILLERLGRERMAGSFAFRSLKQAGAHLAFGSDWPVVTCDPMPGIQAAVTGLTRTGDVVLPEQNLTVAETLRAYTVDAAFALGLENAGEIKPGGLADLVMLDRNPFDVGHDPSALPKVVMTIVCGEVVYDATS